MWLYYRRLLAEAWKDFRIATGEQVIGALLAAAILAFQIYLGVVHPADVRASWWAIVSPYLLLVMALFLWHLIRAPWKLSLRPSALSEASLKDQTLNLSTSILEFIYARAVTAPKLSASPHFAGYSDMRGAIQRGPYGLTYMDTTEIEKSKQEYRAVAAYEKETLEIYDFRYKRNVAKAIISLKNNGLDSSGLEECVRDLSNEGDPDYSGMRIVVSVWIKGVGKHLETLADQLKEA